MKNITDSSVLQSTETNNHNNINIINHNLRLNTCNTFISHSAAEKSEIIVSMIFLEILDLNTEQNTEGRIAVNKIRCLGVETRNPAVTGTANGVQSLSRT